MTGEHIAVLATERRTNISRADDEALSLDRHRDAGGEPVELKSVIPRDHAA